jgi:hypothetical protein
MTTVAAPNQEAPSPHASRTADVMALIVEVDHGLARHALVGVPADDALLLAIEVVLKAVESHPRLLERNDPLSADDLRLIDDELLIPVIRRGQNEEAWSSVAPATALAFSLRSLIIGMLCVAHSRHQQNWITARAIRDLFLAAAANAESHNVGG